MKNDQKKQSTHPLNPPPLNGGMNSTIPILGGVPFYGGEGAFMFFNGYPEIMRKLHKQNFAK